MRIPDGVSGYLEGRLSRESPCLVWENSSVFTTGEGLRLSDSEQALASGQASVLNVCLIRRIRNIFLPLACFSEIKQAKDLFLSEGATSSVRLVLEEMSFPVEVTPSRCHFYGTTQTVL